MQQNETLHMQPLGDSALVVRLANEVNEATHKKVMHFVQALEKNPFEGFLEAVPTYTNVTIFYNPLQVHRTNENDQTVFDSVCTHLHQYKETTETLGSTDPRVIDLPVLYGGEFGPDLEEVAKRNDLTAEEVIEIHAAEEYLVYMIGFAPGFPYLGGMDARIEMPRKSRPRASIPARSVGIAGSQTGVYPFESPGGWQIIGRTPVDLFLPKSDPPTLIQPGDRLRFVPIDYEEYEKQVGGSSK